MLYTDQLMFFLQFWGEKKGFLTLGIIYQKY